MYETRRKTNGLTPTMFSGTVTKAKPLANTLRKFYNWLLKLDLIPDNIKFFSSYQIRAQATNKLKLYVMDRNEAFDYFYNEGVLKI